MQALFVERQVKAAPVLRRGGFRLIESVGVTAVVGQRRLVVRLDIRGLDTRKTMVRRERWLLSRDGRHVSTCSMLLWLIAVTQIQFAYLAG